MRRPDGEPSPERVNACWNEVVRGRSGRCPYLDSATVRSIAKFQALGAMPSPAPGFVKQLEEDLMRGATVPDAVRLPRGGTPVGAGTRVTTGSMAARPASIGLPPRDGATAFRGFAATLLLLVVVAGLAFFSYSRSNETGRPGYSSALVATPGVSQDLPAAEECQAEPRSRDSVLVLARSTRSQPSVGIANVDDRELDFPPGAAADASTEDQVTAAIRQLVACANAGDILRRWALATDDYIRRTLTAYASAQGEAVERLLDRLIAEGSGGPSAMPIVREVRTLGEGRAAALLEFPASDGNQPTTVAVFVKEGTRWLLDEYGVLAEPGAPTPSTPVAAGRPLATLTVELRDLAFDPATLTVAADTDYVIVLRNVGNSPHTFTVDALGIAVDVAPGATRALVLNAPAGTYEFYDAVPGHREAGMVGTLRVG